MEIDFPVACYTARAEAVLAVYSLSLHTVHILPDVVVTLQYHAARGVTLALYLKINLPGEERGRVCVLRIREIKL